MTYRVIENIKNKAVFNRMVREKYKTPSQEA